MENHWNVRKGTLSKAQRADIARRLAEERLEIVNQRCAPVHPRKSIYTQYVKRLIDIVVAACALILTLPINLVIGVITFIDVGRPIFFIQERIGKDGKVFKLVKFRNMTNETDINGELLPAAQRVTKFGRFVRKTSLDELLNFWSILKGDMSLIGPRPLVLPYAERFSDRHAQRTAVCPGLECPPRERGVGIRSWHDQFENDIWYVENISFLTDCKMIFSLLRFTLDQKNSASRAEVRSTFIGYNLDGLAISFEDVAQDYVDWSENTEETIQELVQYKVGNEIAG